MVNQLQTYMATFLHNTTAEHISIDEKQPSMSTSNVSPLSRVTTVTLNTDLQRAIQNVDDTAALVEPSTKLAASQASTADEVNQRHIEVTEPLITYCIDPADWGNVTNDMLEYFSRTPIRDITTDFSASARKYHNRT